MEYCTAWGSKRACACVSQQRSRMAVIRKRKPRVGRNVLRKTPVDCTYIARRKWTCRESRGEDVPRRKRLNTRRDMVAGLKAWRTSAATFSDGRARGRSPADGRTMHGYEVSGAVIASWGSVAVLLSRLRAVAYFARGLASRRHFSLAASLDHFPVKA